MHYGICANCLLGLFHNFAAYLFFFLSFALLVLGLMKGAQSKPGWLHHLGQRLLLFGRMSDKLHNNYCGKRKQETKSKVMLEGIWIGSNVKMGKLNDIDNETFDAINAAPSTTNNNHIQITDFKEGDAKSPCYWLKFGVFRFSCDQINCDLFSVNALEVTLPTSGVRMREVWGSDFYIV